MGDAPEHEVLAHHYLVGDLETALAEDDRTHETDVHVAVDGVEVVITGTVASPGRREQVLAVAREHIARHAPHHEVVDRLSVLVLGTADDEAL